MMATEIFSLNNGKLPVSYATYSRKPKSYVVYVYNLKSTSVPFKSVSSLWIVLQHFVSQTKGSSIYDAANVPRKRLPRWAYRGIREAYVGTAASYNENPVYSVKWYDDW
jgi:hypothetical protein